MRFDSRTEGPSSWSRMGNGLWKERRGGTYQGEFAVSKDGTFTLTKDGSLKDFGTDGQYRPSTLPQRKEAERQQQIQAETQRKEREALVTQEREKQAELQRQQLEQRRAEIDKMRGSFDGAITNNDSYRRAIDDAHKDGKKIVMVFGKAGDKNTQAVYDAVKAAREQTKDKAIFAFVDVDRIDPNSTFGKYARGMAEKHGPPVTMVFGTKMTADGAAPDGPAFGKKGPVVDSQELVKAIRGEKPAAKQADKPADKPTEQPAGQPVDKPTGQPTDGKQADKPVEKPVEKTPEQLAAEKVADLLKGAANPELKNEDRFKKYSEAIAEADKLKNPEISGRTRAELAFACMQWGADHQAKNDPSKAAACYLAGAQWIMDAGQTYPDLYKDQKFIDRLKTSPLPGTAADLLITRGKENPTWFRPNAEEAKGGDKAYDEKYNAAMKSLQDAMKPTEQSKPKEEEKPPRRRRDPFNKEEGKSAYA